MTHQQDDHDSMRLSISSQEATELLRCLDKWLVLEEDNESPLATVQEKLADAIALAAWLREEVRLDLEIIEGIELAESLVEAAHHGALALPSRGDLVTRTHKKLEAALGGSSEAAANRTESVTRTWSSGKAVAVQDGRN